MSEPLLHRLVLGAIEALREGDPLLMIGIGDAEVRLGWVPDLSGTTGEKLPDQPAEEPSAGYVAHNHGPEDGPGAACRERIVNGRVRGACLPDDTALADHLHAAHRRWWEEQRGGSSAHLSRLSSLYDYLADAARGFLK